jgi:hypothetical protein
LRLGEERLDGLVVVAELRAVAFHSTRTASFYDADGIALDSREFHVCDYATANRTYAGCMDCYAAIYQELTKC